MTTQLFWGGCLIAFLFLVGVECRPRSRGSSCYLEVYPNDGILSVSLRQDATFVCSATCLGPLRRGQLYWKYPNGSIIPDLGPHRVFGVGYNLWMMNRLVILSALSDDNGVYTCEIDRDGDRMSYTALLSVNGDVSREDEGPRRGDIFVEPDPEFGDIRPVREASQDSRRRYRTRQMQARHRSLLGSRFPGPVVGDQKKAPGEGMDKGVIRLLTRDFDNDVKNTESRVLINEDASNGAVRIRRASGVSSQAPKDTTTTITTTKGNLEKGSISDTTILTEYPSFDIYGPTMVEHSTERLPFDNYESTTTKNSSQSNMFIDDGADMVTADERKVLLVSTQANKEQMQGTKGSTSEEPRTQTTSSSDERGSTSALQNVTTESSGIQTSTALAGSGSGSKTDGGTGSGSSPTSSSFSVSTTSTETSSGKPSGGSGSPGSSGASGRSGVQSGGDQGQTGSFEESKGEGEDEESDFGRYGVLAFCLALAVILLLLVALVLCFVLPRFCKQKKKHVLNLDDSRKETSNDNSNVLLMGERPHKPLAPMTSATGLNGEYITAVDLDVQPEEQEEGEGKKGGGEDRKEDEVLSGTPADARMAESGNLMETSPR